MKKKLQARLQYARFLQETVGEMAREVKSSSTGDKKKTAEDLVAFMQKVGGPEPLRYPVDYRMLKQE
jgi:LETM1 and EF-hand domain-containing protein 1